MGDTMEDLLKEILERLVDMEETIDEFQDTVLERLDRIDEALSNISTPGGNFGIEYDS